jgi:hypothetical protein
MKTNSVFCCRRISQAIAAILIFVGTSEIVTAKDPVAVTESASARLLVYESEKIAYGKLEEWLKKQAKASGVAVKQLIPLPAVEIQEFISAGQEVRVTGTAKQVAKFLEKIERRDRFHVIPSLNLATDRSDPEVMHLNCILREWFARDEKAAGKVKEWRAEVTPPIPTVECYASCSAALPEKGVRITGFSFSEDEVMIAGEGMDSSVANKFASELHQQKSLDDYKFTWQMRPKDNRKKKNGWVEFAIMGNRVSATAENVKQDSGEPLDGQKKEK